MKSILNFKKNENTHGNELSAPATHGNELLTATPAPACGNEWQATPSSREQGFKIPTMLTIDETAKITNMAKHYIRSLVVENKIIHVRCGRKYLINLEKFIEYLNTSKGDTVPVEPDEPDNKYGVKPIEV